MDALPPGRVLLVPGLVASLAVPTFVAFCITAVRGENPIVYGLLLLLAEATHLVAIAALNRRS